jgi:hypothetical protein
VIVPALLAAAVALGAPASAGAPEAPRAPAEAQQTVGGMVSLSLVEALAAIKQPQLGGVFSFISEKDAPFAFADLMARDRKLMKKYLDKLDADRKAGNGLTDWDHAVCASLVNLYSSPAAESFVAKEPKLMSRINECVLAPVVPLEAIVAGRRK